MHRYLLAAGLLATALYAEPAAPASNDALLAELTARNARNRVVKRTALPDQPVVGLFGDLADPQPGAPDKAAKAFLEKYGALLGFPPGTQFPGNLATFRDEKDEDGHSLTLVPTKNGVPYLTGAIGFTFDKDGKLRRVTGRYRNLDSAKMGSMDAGQAAEKALKLLSEKIPGAFLSADGTVREYLAVGEGDSLRHVYEVELPLGTGRVPELVVLGPGGELIHHRSSASHFDATGTVFPEHPSRATKSMPLTDLVTKSDAKAPKSKRLWGKYFYPQSDAILYASSKDGKYDYNTRLQALGIDLFFYDPRFLEVNVYYHLMRARKQAIEAGKVTAVDIGRAQLFDVWQYPIKGRKQSMNNAYYVNSAKEWHFPVINPAFPSTPPLFETGAVDASIIYHEYGHHVLNVLSPDILASASSYEELFETLAIGEGFSDFFSYTITKHEKVGDIFGNSKKTRPVGNPGVDRCKLFDYVAAEAKAGRLASFHQSGILFSTICRELETVYADKTLEVVLKALKRSVPRSFGAFANEVASFAETDGGGKNSDIVFDLLAKRKMFECDLGATPLPEDFKADDTTGMGE